MNAYLFAAGNGMRLRPVTENVQKCLLHVGGKPMLRWWLDAVFHTQRFEKVFVNLHHCADAVEKWIDDYCFSTGNVVNLIDERAKLLGTAGTLFWHADLEEDLFVAYTDTWSDSIFNFLPEIFDYWEKNPKEVIAGLVGFPPPEDLSAGLMRVDPDGTVLSFDEKAGIGDVAWAGVLFARKEFYSFLEKEDKDLARDVLPRLVGKARVISRGDAFDIGRGLKYYEQLNERIRQAQ